MGGVSINWEKRSNQFHDHVHTTPWWQRKDIPCSRTDVFKIKYFYLSKAQIILRIEGVDVEVLRNLFHCSTTYLPFGQRQQSSQVVLGQVKPMHNNWYRMNVYYSPVGSMPLFPLQIARSKVASLCGLSRWYCRDWIRILTHERLLS